MIKIRRLLALIAAACILCIALPAFADVIIDPQGDSFYKKHSSECSVGDFRSYVSAGENGIEIYDKPNGKVIDTIEAGETIGSNCIYRPQTGDWWGYKYNYADESKEGWFRLADTLRLYDGIDFENENFASIKNYSGESMTLKSAVLYDYPGGPISFTDYSTAEEDDPIGFSRCYTDENGRQWGFIGYHYGHVDSWVCIDDPANAELSAAEQTLMDPITGERVKTIPLTALAGDADNTDDPSSAETDRPSGPKQTIDPNMTPGKLEPKKKDGKTSPWLVGGIVAAAAGVCAAVLGVCFKKRSARK